MPWTQRQDWAAAREADSVRRSNRRKGVAKEVTQSRRCLKCAKPFQAEGPYIRLCEKHRGGQ